MTEQELKNSICEWLEKRGCLFTISPPRRGYYNSRFLRVGWPDLYGVWKGKPLFIEVKLPEGVLSMKQLEVLEAAKKQGAIAFVATSVETVAKELGG